MQQEHEHPPGTVSSPARTTAVASLSTQDQFVQCVRQYVKCDNMIQDMNKRVRALREDKAQITPLMTQYMENNGLCKQTVRITGGTLKYHVDTVPQGFTQKFLASALTEYFGGDAQKADECMTFMKGKREHKRTVLLKRTYAVDKGGGGVG